jgi:ADP-ribose pyrophosphatase
MSKNKWETIHTASAGKFVVFEVQQHTKKLPDAEKEYNFFTLDTPDWINIIPLTANQEVVFIRQYRHGSDAISLEVPAGVVETTDTDAANTARREMLEETGYDSQNIVKLGVVRPNPALFNNRGHVFVAFDAKPTQTQNLDESELIDTELIPLADVTKLIATGEIDHALVIATFSLLTIYLAQQQTS